MLGAVSSLSLINVPPTTLDEEENDDTVLVRVSVRRVPIGWLSRPASGVQKQRHN